MSSIVGCSWVFVLAIYRYFFIIKCIVLESRSFLLLNPCYVSFKVSKSIKLSIFEIFNYLSVWKYG